MNNIEILTQAIGLWDDCPDNGIEYTRKLRKTWAKRTRNAIKNSNR